MLSEAIVIGAHIHNECSPADVMVFSQVVLQVLRADLVLRLTHVILTDMIKTYQLICINIKELICILCM